MSKRTPENAVKKELKNALHAIGIPSYPYTVGLGGQRGFPDRFAITRGHVVWFECKADGKRAEPQQQAVHELLRAAGATVFMVWPHNIKEVIQLVYDIRADLIQRGVGGPSEERLFPVPAGYVSRAVSHKKRRPVRPEFSSGADDPEQHSFAASIRYQGTQQN